ncbi:hypothetical protein [Embleya sp. NPDC001921]
MPRPPAPAPSVPVGVVPPARPADELLRLAVVNRPVPDVARMLAIIEDCSGVSADDALREAALKRPVSDLVQLAELLSDPTHAEQGRRPPEPRTEEPASRAGEPPGPAGAARAQFGSAVGKPRGRPWFTGSGVVAGVDLRWPMAAGLAVGGLASAALIPSSIRQPPFAATWLMVLAVVCLFLAGVVAVKAGRTARATSFVAGCATIATYLASRRPADGPTDWLDPHALIIATAGLITVGCAATYLGRVRKQPSRRGIGASGGPERFDALVPERRLPGAGELVR